MITRTDIETQVLAAIEGWETEHDVQAIVDEIHDRYGLVSTETVPDFWEIVERHAR